MESDLPKVLHEVGRKPIIIHTIETLKKSKKILEIIVVTGYKSEQVEQSIYTNFSDIRIIRQEDIYSGTGGAAYSAIKRINNNESIIVMNGDDSLFYQIEDIDNAINIFDKENAYATFFVVKDLDKRQYRKILLDTNGKFQELTKEISLEGNILTGFYIFNLEFIKNYLEKIKIEDSSTEMKLTDFLYDEQQKNKFVALEIDEKTWFGINTQDELRKANQLFLELKNAR